MVRLYPVMAWKRCTKRDIGALRANRIVYRRSGGRNELKKRCRRVLGYSNVKTMQIHVMVATKQPFIIRAGLH